MTVHQYKHEKWVWEWTPDSRIEIVRWCGGEIIVYRMEDGTPILCTKAPQAVAEKLTALLSLGRPGITFTEHDEKWVMAWANAKALPGEIDVGGQFVWAKNDDYRE